MRRTWYSALFLLVVALAVVSCKSEFEKIRTSGDPDLLYRSAMDYYQAEEYQKAQSLLELVISSFRGKKEAEEIYFKYAYTYYHLGRYILASYYFRNFSQTYTSSDKREEAEFMSAYSNYQLSPIYRLDQSYTNKAIEEFQLFVNTYPNSERVEECNGLIDEMRAKLEKKAFEEGKLYFDVRQYQAAINTYENLLRDFPETDAVEEVRYRILRSSYLLAINSVINRQTERFEDEKKKAEAFLRRFPESTYRKEVEQMLAVAVDKLKELENVGYQNTGSGN